MKRSLCSVVVWLAIILLARSETYYVATSGLDTRTGLGDWTNAVLTISNGVAKATNVNDTVLVSNGEYVLTAQINVANQITVRSWNNGAVDWTNTIVNGNNGVRCFNITHTGAVVEGLTICRGMGAGGGVFISPGGTLKNCNIVSNNAGAGNGGGIYISSGTNTLLDNCIIANNIATNGGGIYFTTLAGAKITNCAIRDNRTLSINLSGNAGGGGIYMGTNTIMDNCRVYGNQSAMDAGGVFVYYVGGCIVRNCSISNNMAAQNGGGIKIIGYQALITNCTLSDNASTNSGGGIYVNVGGVDIANCRIIGNRAHGIYGGGVCIYNVASRLLNSEIRDNSAGDGGGGVYARMQGAGCVIRNCLIVGNNAVNDGGGIRMNYSVLMENCTVVSNWLTTGTKGGGVSLSNSSFTNYLVNCIIYYNTVPSGSYSNYCNNIATDRGSYSNCCLAPALTGGAVPMSANNITSAPQFVEKDADNWQLKKESLCVNSGVNREWMDDAKDLGGRSRLDRFSRLVDMGAYEFVPAGTMFLGR